MYLYFWFILEYIYLFFWKYTNLHKKVNNFSIIEIISLHVTIRLPFRHQCKYLYNSFRPFKLHGCGKHCGMWKQDFFNPKRRLVGWKELIPWAPNNCISIFYLHIQVHLWLATVLGKTFIRGFFGNQLMKHSTYETVALPKLKDL